MVILCVLVRSGWLRLLLLPLPLPLLGLGSWLELGFRIWLWARAGERIEGVGLEGDWMWESRASEKLDRCRTASLRVRCRCRCRYSCSCGCGCGTAGLTAAPCMRQLLQVLASVLAVSGP